MCKSWSILVILLLSSIVCGADNSDGVNALGRGNYEQALIEFRPGAEDGDVSSRNFLAYTYVMLEDYEKAYAWYHLSAECGSIDADIDREVLSRKMSPTQIEKARVLGTEYFELYCGK
jgi:TPR repeat protein